MSNIPMKRLIVGEDNEAFEVMDAHAIHFDGPQVLTPEEQAQAQENLGVKGYYSTTREDPGFKYCKDINSAAIWGLYDALMAEHPDRVQKNEIHNNDGTFTNYEYVISTGEYNAEGEFAELYGDKDIKKPKYLISSGIHGYEKPAIISVYRFIRDVLEGRNIPAQFREGCAIHVMPVGNPYSLDNCTRNNENDVDINRNFNWNWVQRGEDEGKWSGSSAASEKETQAIANWLLVNQDAKMFFDCHTTLANPNEVVWFIGLDNSQEYERSKRIALRGIGRVIPFWRDIIGYAEETVYTISLSFDGAGYAISYASEVVGIPSLALELSGLQNEVLPDGVNAYNAPITPETVSAGAEVIGNALIEFYEQSFTKEVNECMEVIDGKLDTLLFQVNSGFRVETGSYTVEADITSESEAIVELPCKGVKILSFVSDDATRTKILDTTSGIWMVGFVGQTITELPYILETYIRCGGYVSRMNAGKLENAAGIILDTDNGVKFGAVGLKAGTYNWTAYYWNE